MLTGRYVAGVCECFHENCMVESLTYRDVTGRERDVYVVCESHLKLQRPYVFFSQRLDRLIDVNYSFASIIGCAVFVRLIIDFCRKYSINRLIERLSGITIHEPVILLYFEYNLVAEKIVTMKVFCCFLIIRLLSAFFLHITDCDETYNYWEPLHYLTQGKGLQTWEYSPEYGLRSYFYLLLHAVPSFLLKTILDVDAIIAFYATRCMLAVICSVMETILFKVISQCFGNKIASWWLTFQLISPGLFISGTALLPSSFSMYLTMALHSAWWSKKIKLPIFLTVVSTFVGWPFAAITSLAFVYDILINRRFYKTFVYWSLLCALCVGMLLLIVDSFFYGKITFPPINIVLYNIFTTHGPDLFGVESHFFYFVNLFLNFNLIWIFAFLYPLIMVAYSILSHFTTLHDRQFWTDCWKISSLYIWMFVFFMQPHKEERFLFPVYPLLTLCGAVSICTTGTIANYFAHVLRFDKKTYFHLLAKITNHVLKWCIFVLCASRLYSLYSNYHAPMRISLPLQKTSTEQNICVGNEWHRFPGSFFIPANYNLRFIRSHFNGMLPAYFSQSENGTTIIHSYFNNMNRANEYMLVNISNCDFLINFDDGKHYNIQDVEPNYSKDTVTWEIVKSLKFLNTKSSNKLYRAFYIPLLTPKYVNYGNYDLLKRKLLK
ncbi:alpha-1,2-mannosyltransferase ALG9 isoform X1 [Toxorhynchites rutilus septentrionalis]|uniref:alpha-1,2-mannosyltransferase ALG9 isoform X1 n=1 Tax=Toxorhynchites rutilus septentrionalis TaxID=329112 RepID=UPI0024787D0B|nr:alpha-1,2-mannosyltransferase ALG9 isoform X1 [Toxorhynchites rutilus septentrionalis]